MILGPITFPMKAIRSATIPSEGAVYAAHEVIEGKPRRQKVARKSGDMQLGCYFHQEFMSVATYLAALVALVDSGKIVTLQSPNGYVWGSFVVDGISQSDPRILPGGALLAVTVTVSLLDPGLRRDIVPPAPVAVAGATNVPTTTTPPAEDRSTPPGETTARQIARAPS